MVDNVCAGDFDSTLTDLETSLDHPTAVTDQSDLSTTT